LSRIPKPLFHMQNVEPPFQPYAHMEATTFTNPEDTFLCNYYCMTTSYCGGCLLRIRLFFALEAALSENWDLDLR